MSNPYTSVSVTNYNANPPDDDASEVASNQVEWAKHLSKIGNPLKTAIQSINSNNSTAHNRHVGQTFETKSGDYSIAAPGDRGKIFSVDATATITLPLAADAGDGFPVLVFNSITGPNSVTVDGNGAETINGGASITLVSNEFALLTCDGTSWVAVGNFTILGSFAATLTGFSSDPVGATVKWAKNGNIVTATFNWGVGTSNSTAYTITNWAAAIRPLSVMVVPLVGVVDNGVNSYGSLTIGSAGTVTFNFEAGGGGWTGSGNKGFNTGLGGDFSISYPMRRQ